MPEPRSPSRFGFLGSVVADARTPIRPRSPAAVIGLHQQWTPATPPPHDPRPQKPAPAKEANRPARTTAPVAAPPPRHPDTPEPDTGLPTSPPRLVRPVIAPSIPVATTHSPAIHRQDAPPEPQAGSAARSTARSTPPPGPEQQNPAPVPAPDTASPRPSPEPDHAEAKRESSDAPLPQRAHAICIAAPAVPPLQSSVDQHPQADDRPTEDRPAITQTENATVPPGNDQTAPAARHEPDSPAVPARRSFEFARLDDLMPPSPASRHTAHGKGKPARQGPDVEIGSIDVTVLAPEPPARPPHPEPPRASTPRIRPESLHYLRRF